MKNMARILAVSFSILAAWLGVSCADPETKDPDIVLRVSIAEDVSFVRIYIKQPYKICAVGSEKPLLEGPCIATKIVNVKDGLMIYDKIYKVPAIRIKTDKDSRMYVDKKLFRGAIDIVKKGNGRLLVINYVSLDDYLYGVLYHEVSHRWPMEVLKAQAIAARTFALYQARHNKLQPYDLRSDIYSQVYGGSDFERWSTTMAVNVTKGKALTYNGDLLPCYYHATCAGHTEDAANLWKVDLPALRGVPCDYCKESPYYCTWTKEIPLYMLECKLRDGGYKIGKIAGVTVLSRNASGRVDKVEVRDDGGVSVIMTGKDFRQLVGPNEARSTRFEPCVKWGVLVLEGSGWGHGVGMCQWGAYGQAKQGRKADEILQYYYPGSRIMTIDKIKDKL